MVRVHDQHRVTAELEDGAPEDTDMETLPPLQSVIFESKPAIAPKGQQDMPFAKVKFLFTNMTTPTGQCACKVCPVTLPDAFSSDAVWCFSMVWGNAADCIPSAHQHVISVPAMGA